MGGQFMTGKRFKAGVMLLLAAALSIVAAGSSANAYTTDHLTGIHIFSQQSPSIGFAVKNGQVVLAPVSNDTTTLWNVTVVGPSWPGDSVFTNVATGTCLAAPSPIDSLALKMAPCNTADPYQQWSEGASQLSNLGTDRCARAESLTAGARLYQEICNGSNKTEWDDRLRVKLTAVSGDAQSIPAGRAGRPLVAKITDENDQPLAGFKVTVALHGPWGGEDYLPSPATFGTGSVTSVTITSDPQGLATTAAVTGKANAHSSYSATVSAIYSLSEDLFILQPTTFTGTVG